METNKVLELAAVYLQREDLLQTNIFDESGKNPSQNQINDAHRMLRCLNLVLNEISTDYLPLKAVQRFETSNGIILLNSFNNKFITAYKVERNNGNACKFKIFPDYMQTVSGEIFITYSFLPDKVNFDDTFLFYDNRLPENTIAQGIAMEYSYITGAFDDAVMWEKRYKDSLEITSRKKSEAVWKKRRWI